MSGIQLFTSTSLVHSNNFQMSKGSKFIRLNNYVQLLRNVRSTAQEANMFCDNPRIKSKDLNAG